jgi:UDP-3-O-[3-hydroxymyristoyl] glucosamine N-acyltransferase
MSANKILIVGFGETFDSIQKNFFEYLAVGDPIFINIERLEALTNFLDLILEHSKGSQAQFFSVMENTALNFQRFDLYGKLRKAGLSAVNLVHKTAVIQNGCKLGENVHIGVGSIVSSGANIGNNIFIGNAARIDGNVKISSNSWIGSGAAIGSQASIGSNCTIGGDVTISRGVEVGKNCEISIPNVYTSNITAGTFYDSLFPSVVRIY